MLNQCMHIIILTILFIINGTSSGQNLSNIQSDSLRSVLHNLQQQIDSLKQDGSRDELEELQRSALELSEGTDQSEEVQSFEQKSRSLRALNPDISLVGDAFAAYNSRNKEGTEGDQEDGEHEHGHGELRSGFTTRVFAVHLESNLDPFSFAKAAIEFGSHGIELTEAYLTWTNPFPGTSLTFGRFRQQFGIINRWHEHALDQTFFPLPIRLYMGDEGLAQTGISANILLPSFIAHANELTLQVTNSENETLFGGDQYSLPAGLFHLKNYYDITPATYFEWGLSGIAGTNDNLGFDLDVRHSWSYLGGVDFTISWKPARRGLYRGITWRNELFYLTRDNLSGNTINALGAYSYLNYRLSRKIIAGLRLDYAQLPEYQASNLYQYQIVPYLTLWQSEYVYLRFQYNYSHGNELDTPNHQMFIQIDWSVGPHKHEKY